jgi:hypothetical protein
MRAAASRLPSSRGSRLGDRYGTYRTAAQQAEPKKTASQPARNGKAAAMRLAAPRQSPAIALTPPISKLSTPPRIPPDNASRSGANRSQAAQMSG